MADWKAGLWLQQGSEVWQPIGSHGERRLGKELADSMVECTSALVHSPFLCKQKHWIISGVQILRAEDGVRLWVFLAHLGFGAEQSVLFV